MQEETMVEIAKSTSSPPSPAASSENFNLLRADDNQSKSDQPTKKRRNLPGMPDPDAEVIALSPKSLLATNRFLCEVCNKGFQRDQNLQLHRRGHNLPWKLRQRTSAEVRKRVYVCPEPSCVHHDPSRALGDLTGIKKHFSRKHGEKKFKCDKCAKKYAVQSDWKAHMKTCGTKEYRCDCGTLFSRRDSFITHRAFCDALAQENARSQPPLATIPTSSGENSKPSMVAPVAETSGPPPPPLTPSTGALSPVLSIQNSAELHENQSTQIHQEAQAATLPTLSTPLITTSSTVSITTSSLASNVNNSTVFADASTSSEHPQSPLTCIVDPISLSLSSSLYATSSLLQNPHQRQHFYVSTSPQPALSATALLQKAAQIGATSSSSFLRGLGMSNSASTTMASISAANWGSSVVKLENSSLASGLGLGLPSGEPSPGFNEFVMGQPGLYGTKPATLDFLGLGGSMGARGGFFGSVSDGLDLANASFSGGETWDDASETKPSTAM